MLHSYSIYYKKFRNFARVINDFPSLKQAEEYSTLVKQEGGAGTVFTKGENFVFVSSYPTLSEAKEIKQNLLDLGYKSRIVNLKVESIFINYKGKNEKQFLSAINFFRKCYNSLQNQVINFDKNQLSQNQVNSVLTSLIAENVNLINKLSSLNQSHDLPLKDLIIVPLKEVRQNLEQVLCFVGDDLSYTSKLKEICIKIILENKNLVDKINAL